MFTVAEAPDDEVSSEVALGVRMPSDWVEDRLAVWDDEGEME